MILKPKKFTPDEQKKITQMTYNQKVSSGYKATTDGKPMHKVALDKNIRVYIPNHLVTIDDEVQMAMDVGIFHDINEGKFTKRVRCVSGVEGYSTCPLCECNGEHFELANLKIEDEIKSTGAVEGTDEWKDIRRKHYGNKVLGNTIQRVTFPIVVLGDGEKESVSLDTKSGKKEFKYGIYWYSSSMTTFKKLFVPIAKTLEGTTEELDDLTVEDSADSEEMPIPNPAGHFYMFDYRYDTKVNRPMQGMQQRI